MKKLLISILFCNLLIASVEIEYLNSPSNNFTIVNEESNVLILKNKEKIVCKNDSIIKDSDNYSSIEYIKDGIIIRNYNETSKFLGDEYFKFLKSNDKLILVEIGRNVRDYELADNKYPFQERIFVKLKNRDFDFEEDFCKCNPYVNRYLNKKYGFKYFTFAELDSNFRNTYVEALQKDNIREIYTKNIIYKYLNEVPLSAKTLTQYNDIAYYLEKTQAYQESIYLLEKIIEKYPNRIVAYINLGDAYLGNKQKDKAIQSYKKYIELMKQAGKENKIPKRVLELVNDSKPLTKNQSQIIPQKEEKTFFSKLLEWFGFSQFNKNINIKYS